MVKPPGFVNPTPTISKSGVAHTWPKHALDGDRQSEDPGIKSGIFCIQRSLRVEIAFRLARDLRYTTGRVNTRCS